MKITKAVIDDLLPLYMADELSEDSRMLVDAYKSKHPKFEQELKLRNPEELNLKMEVPLTQETEMHALQRTKIILRWRAWLLAAALFFTLMPFAFTFDSSGVNWLFMENPRTLLVFGIAGIASWFGYRETWLKVRHTGL